MMELKIDRNNPLVTMKLKIDRNMLQAELTDMEIMLEASKRNLFIIPRGEGSEGLKQARKHVIELLAMIDQQLYGTENQEIKTIY